MCESIKLIAPSWVYSWLSRKAFRSWLKNREKMIEIKDPDVLIGLLKWQFHSKLQALVYWVVTHYSNVTITESYRPQRHKNDLHGIIPVRAIDIRSWNFPDPSKIEDRINEVWIYDFNRPWKKCAVFHDTGEGPHFHLQVHKNTRMRG